MTEAEWLACEDLEQIWANAPYQMSDRRWRLYACACCRLIPDFMASAPDVRCLWLAEAEADRLLGSGEVAYPDDDEFDIRWYRRDAKSIAHRAVTAYRDFVWGSERDARQDRVEWVEIGPIADPPLIQTLRDIFGNPFRPVAFDAAWRTSDVTALATGIFAEKAFDRMPILADALQEAGCDSDELLNHLRSAGPHVKGCWALDLVLGKE